MLRRSILVSSFLAASAVACGNVIVDPNGGSGGSTSSSTSTATTTTSTATTVTSTTGVGGGPACGETHDALSLQLSTYDGHAFSCKGESGDHAMNAVVIDVTGNTVTLDSCPPNADCIPFISTLVIDAPGLFVVLPKSTFVRVHVSSFNFQGGCGQKVMITNLSSWGGEPNPIVSGEVLWLMAADGDGSPFEDAPLVPEAVPLGCFPDDPPGCGDHDDYLWRFRSALTPEDPGTTLAMGQTYSWSFTSGSYSHEVLGRNLRSFSLGICDGPSDLAYWVVHKYGVD